MAQRVSVKFCLNSARAVFGWVPWVTPAYRASCRLAIISEYPIFDLSLPQIHCSIFPLTSTKMTIYLHSFNQITFLSTWPKVRFKNLSTVGNSFVEKKVENFKNTPVTKRDRSVTTFSGKLAHDQRSCRLKKNQSIICFLQTCNDEFSKTFFLPALCCATGLKVH